MLHSFISNDRTKIIVKGKVYWIRIRELEPWSPELDDEFCKSSSDDEFVGDEKNNSITGDANDHVSESSFMNENIENVINEQEPPQDKISEDPFGIYNILNKQDNKEASAICLDRHLSDHRPIIMREVVTDYGSSPFRVYQSWF
ncbi:hypothetical protein Tco_0379822, partial [Tanacetum coccineum]